MSCSLQKNFEEITYLLHNLQHNFNFVGFTETRLNQKTIIPVIGGYNSYHSFSNSNAGGTSLYISSDLISFERKDLSDIMSSTNLESTFVQITRICKSDIIVGCIYKHPNMKVEDFISSHLEPFCDKILSENKTFILLGDFNIDLLKYDSNKWIDKFLDVINSNSLQPTITIPTRITTTSETLIDNIFMSQSLFSADNSNIITGNILADVSDHLPQFVIVPQNYAKKNESSNIFIRDMNKLNLLDFHKDIIEFDWNKVTSLDVNCSFENFF